MSNNLNILWKLTLAELQEVCSAVGIMPIGTRGELIKQLVSMFSLDKIELLMKANKNNTRTVSGEVDITTKCKTCGNA